MNTKNLLSILLLLLSITGYSQSKEDFNWAFGEGVGVTFNTAPPSAFGHALTTGHEVYEGMASISDKNGVLQFYTNGLSVYQANGVIMSGGNNTLPGSDDGGGVSAAQGVF